LPLKDGWEIDEGNVHVLVRGDNNSHFRCKWCGSKYWGGKSRNSEHINKCSMLPKAKKNKRRAADISSAGNIVAALAKQTATHKEVDCGLAIAFSVLNLPFRDIENPAFMDLFLWAKRSPPSYVLPSRKKFGNECLDSAYADSQTRKNNLLGNLIHVGCTFGNDGVKVNNRSVVNTVVQSPYGPVIFAQSTNTTGVTKDTAFIVKDVLAAIALFTTGLSFYLKIIICMDGASVCKAAMAILRSVHHYLTQRCAAHAGSLAVKDVAGIPIFKSALKDMIYLITFFKSHEWFLSRYSEVGGRLLLNPAETRFGKFYIAAEIVIKELPKIQNVATLPATAVYLVAHGAEERDELENGVEKKVQLRKSWKKVRTLMFNDEWQAIINYFLVLAAPIYHFLREMDKKTPTLQWAAAQYDESSKLLSEVPVDSEIEVGGDPDWKQKLKDKAIQSFRKRQNDCVTELAKAAAYLNIELAYQLEPWMPVGAMNALTAVCCTYFRKEDGSEDNETASQVVALAVDMRLKAGLFKESTSLKISRHKGAEHFWSTIEQSAEGVEGCDFIPQLANLALLLASNFASQSAVEWENKATKEVLTKKRNRLLHAKVSKIRTIASYYSLNLSQNSEKKRSFLKNFHDDARLARKKRADDAAKSAERARAREAADDIMDEDMDMDMEIVDENEEDDWGGALRLDQLFDSAVDDLIDEMHSDDEDQGVENDDEDQGLANDDEDQGVENDDEDQGLANDNEGQGLANDNEDHGLANDNEDHGLANDEA
jgi:hypothetical protein